MLETVREFAQEQLEASGESAAVGRGHMWHCLQVAQESLPGSRAQEQQQALHRLERELGNFRAALDWCLAQGYADPALRLATDLEWFWGARGRVSEGRSRLEALLARFPLRAATGARAGVHARALLAAGRLATFQLDISAADAWLRQSLELCEQLEDGPGMCDALYGLSLNKQEQADYAAARLLIERGLALSRALATSSGELDLAMDLRVGVGLVGLGVTAALAGDA